MLFFICTPAFPASISLGDVDQEIIFADEKLKIICPKNDFVFYVCDVEEIYDMEPVSAYTSLCKENKGVGKLIPGVELKCPICGTEPYKNIKMNGVKATKVFTNKGWMPQRIRPRLY